MWALIPGFSGVGMLLAKVLGGNERYNAGSALSTIGTSLVLFVVFGAFFGGFFMDGSVLGLLLLIAAGLADRYSLLYSPAKLVQFLK